MGQWGGDEIETAHHTIGGSWASNSMGPISKQGRGLAFIINGIHEAFSIALLEIFYFCVPLQPLHRDIVIRCRHY